MSFAEFNIFGSLFSFNGSKEKSNFEIKKGNAILCEESVKRYPVLDCGCGKGQNCEWTKKGKLFKILFSDYEGSTFSKVFEDYLDCDDSDFFIKIKGKCKGETEKNTLRNICYFQGKGRGVHPEIIIAIK